ncbi:28S ribosomal protein S5, mitochondrial [Exophiala dermatitidis]|uniref:Small ribosomal subunit protein uS5m n=2 Tax=Exophiala dermatitidis TaxID=5970 RepID=H6C6A6_EXODN|nr:30S ribosomal protein S5 [Exophiala dermatitidis NIH/UT8656]KAJ4522968.1 28S ribosomal protein S5, mitochondrial [Exophiala dermatitidis]EHY59252.1 30S ribosomal protein S5 [Exophiala dermatitidis NIH/UT8656]KAJ4526286.1 28S ribosomal protein S5, mitochondrial [Exophiala dermatitidis]KAJ4526771.1 28S ribosomal protein S5, mitochondrial [Exophiala dermatitidis]KAJ4532476.1 28S ribosomal protein S5, mitochondrial [Exophiala dermatitidis]
MSIFRPSECVFCLFSRSSRPAAVVRRQFHSSPVHQKRKPRYPSVKSSNNQINLAQAAKQFSASQDGAIPQHYSAEQRAAIEAAQKLIDTEKLEKQTGMRKDPWKMKYFDDLTKIDPVVDKPVRAPWTNIDDQSRLKTEEELEDDLIKFMKKIPEPKHENDYDPELWDKFDRDLRLTVGREEAERNPRTAMAPDLPNISNNPRPKKQTRGDEVVEIEPPSPALVRLMQMTGYSREQIARLRVKRVISHSVTNQTRLGKIRKQYVLYVAGNQNGLIGIGEGKAVDPEDASLQAQYRAIRNMTPILRYENRTIFGDVNGKVSATELELYSRPPGFGLRCQQYIYEICKCAGIHDLAARVTRARNPMNTVKATIQALLSQKDPEDIARARGKKLVDVRKVYYAGET